MRELLNIVGGFSSVGPSRMRSVDTPKRKKRGLIRSLKLKTYLIYRKKRHQLRNLLALVTRALWRLSRSQISETARIHPTAYVSPFKVKIGSNCVIGPHAVVQENSILDDGVDVAAGCVIGSEGFVYRVFGKKVIHIIHTGGVHIHRGVRIQSFTCVDRSTDGGYTEIGEESNVGEMIHIAHDVKLGKRCHVQPHAMVAGHVIAGDDVIICHNASISNSLVIGNSVRIGPGAVVTRTVQDGKSLSGNFAIDSTRHRIFMKSVAEGNFGWLI